MNGKAKKILRLDVLLVEKGLAPNLDKARAYIGAGKVRIDGLLADKSGHLVPLDSTIEISNPPQPYVSRGGVKLAHALEHFSINVSGLIGMDVGASTGGFTDCLLKNGAVRIYAVDVGYGQLDWTLRNDNRVVVMERTNIRYLAPQAIGEQIDIVTADTSFISLKKVIPATMRIIHPGSMIIALIKPQFEVDRTKIEKGGIIKNSLLHQEVLDDLTVFFKNNLNLEIMGLIRSPILGVKGNTEFLIYMRLKHQTSENTLKFQYKMV